MASLSKQYTVYIDTTVKGSFIAVMAHSSSSTGEGELLSHCLSLPRQSAALSELLESCLTYADLQLDQINRVLVGNGPGSFTGIKVGLAFAQGLRLARPELNIAAISSLEALAWSHPNRLFLMPATKNQGYGALYRQQSEYGRPLLFAVDIGSGHLQLRAEDDTEYQELNSVNFDRVEFISPWLLCKDFLVSQAMLDLNQITTFDRSLNMHRMMLAAFDYSHSDCFKGLDRNVSASAGVALEPRYLRHSAPEEALMSKSKGVN